MSRNSSGVYTLPNAPVVTNTTITSTDENTTRSDIASEITNSLDRNGRGAMLAPLQLADGTPSLPGLTFGTNTNTGMYRIGANIIGFALAGALAFTFAATGLTIAGGVVGTDVGDMFIKAGGANMWKIASVGGHLTPVNAGQNIGSSVNPIATITASASVVTPLVGNVTDTTLNFQVNNAAKWGIATSAGVGGAAAYTLFPAGDGTQDIGGPVTRIRTGYFSTSVITPLLTSAASLLIQTPGGGNFEFSSGTGVIRANSDNTHVFGDNTHRWITLYTFNVDSGSGASLFLRTGNGNTSFEVIQAGAGAVNWWGASGQATGITPFLGVRGETNITGVLQGLKGTGTFRINEAVNNTTQFEVLSVPTAARWLTVAASIAGAPTLDVTAGGILNITPAVVIAGVSLTINTSAAVASAGSIRLPNIGSIQSRNAANSGDVSMLQMQTINSVSDIIVIGGAGLVVVARAGAGAPTTTDLAAGRWTVWRDTTGATTKVYYNNAGAIIASAAFT